MKCKQIVLKVLSLALSRNLRFLRMQSTEAALNDLK